MKQCYLKSIAIVAITALLLYYPKQSFSQCACSGGVNPDSVVQNQLLDPITAINTAIVFQKFDPSLGTMNCFKLSSRVTTIIDIDLFNKEGFAVDYLLESFRRSNFSGPGGFFSNVSSPAKQYGPFNLKAFDGPASDSDEVHIGPDTVFNNLLQEKTSTSTAAYSGVGTVAFNYLNTSTTTLLLGSSNYDLQVRGNTKLDVTLKYYYCPNAVLATNIQNFTAARKDGSIDLSWLATNARGVKTFIIETSTDGKTFSAVALVTADGNENASYNYRHPATATGKYIYFRIRQTDDKGKSAYSAIRTVSLDAKAAPGISMYPNPATNGITINFDRVMSGTYQTELLNMAGQVVYNQQVKLNSTSTLPVIWGKKPNTGLYLVRITNKATSEQQIVRLTIQ
jgi:hypothetical protein